MKKIILLVFLASLVVFAIVIYFLINKGGGLGLGSFPKPTGVPGSQFNGVDEDYNKAFEKLKPAIDAAAEKETRVGALLNKLPYVGKNFALYFNIETGRYILYINPSYRDLGNDEFDTFLKENGVLSRDWLQDLFTTYISPTPAP